MAVILRWCQTLTLLATQCSRIEIERLIVTGSR